MPDRYGFDELGGTVACILEGCEARGPIWDWPERARRAHHLSHGARAVSPTRPRPPVNGERTEATEMAAAKNKISGRDACIAAIRAAGKPLTAGEISTAVVESGVVAGLKGKTPKATLSAQITSGAKKGQVFKRVGTTKPAKFDLKADAPESPADLVEALKAKVAEVISSKPAPAAAPKPAAKAPAAAAAGKGDDVTPDPKK